VIVKNLGKPVARIVPFKASASVRRPGALAGKITIKPGFDDLPSGFDESFLKPAEPRPEPGSLFNQVREFRAATRT